MAIFNCYVSSPEGKVQIICPSSLRQVGHDHRESYDDSSVELRVWDFWANPMMESKKQDQPTNRMQSRKTLLRNKFINSLLHSYPVTRTVPV